MDRGRMETCGLFKGAGRVRGDAAPERVKDAGIPPSASASPAVAFQITKNPGCGLQVTS